MQPTDTKPTPPTTIVNITLHIHRDGTLVQETAEPPGNGDGGDQASQNAPPRSPPPRPDLPTLQADQLLALCRVVRPHIILETYPADRIREVCLAALAAPRRNLGGWVATALSKKWNVKPPNHQETTP